MDKNSFLDYLKVLKLNEAFPDTKFGAGGFRVDPMNLESKCGFKPAGKMHTKMLMKQNKADA